MKRWIFLALSAVMILTLAGCSRRSQQVFEYVEDIPVFSAAPGEIQFDCPEDAALLCSASEQVGALYQQADGDYEITTNILQANGIRDVVQWLSGFPADQVQWQVVGSPEAPNYQFSWKSSDGESELIHRASVICEDNNYYALVFSTKQELEEEYKNCAQEVISSFSVTGKETQTERVEQKQEQ